MRRSCNTAIVARARRTRAKRSSAKSSKIAIPTGHRMVPDQPN
jgi:hypothetical protein